MGITGLVRWVNAPTTGLSLIQENIRRNHDDWHREEWKLSVRSYRSTLGALAPERTMCALTMNENVFVLVDDPFAPTRADLAVHASKDGNGAVATIPDPAHYRYTFLTLNPPGALEQLLTQLRARWATTKQNMAGGSRQPSAQQLAIDGAIYTIGTDWIVRAGNIVLNGNTVKGMLLEAEYLPIATMDFARGSEVVSSLLLSIVPNLPDLVLGQVTISAAQLEDVLWDKEAEEQARREAERAERSGKDEEDVFVSLDGEGDGVQRGDWVGVERDRRSAYLIIGALKSEGLV
ncbi:hypothetical protein K488DRAFT_80664 [Vararia minispora EC-137]|uniref:Uncharacterized protein n=1 Tax=Vararia minispora EC-137 TaxID=1314806 RepID=A0ACB8Q9J0_9AGAM|nr:hypothetical protein K488DRAFT_80664 [Vararia minispora EC-137]